MRNNLVARLRKPHLWHRIMERILFSDLFKRQWIILVARETSRELLSWSNFTPLMPPSDSTWGDPFVWLNEGEHYIFFEELYSSSDQGHITCIKINEQMKYEDTFIVLKRPYHLSYPFIFEYSGQIYMLPETKNNRTIELYRCNRFPDRWEFVKTLMSELSAVDSTLVESNGRWWLFTNIVKDGGTSYDSLYLFSADNPLSNEWAPHPLNPIVKDISSARPAGRIFSQNGTLIRPSQDCSIRYGYSINFNRISTLSEYDYAESTERSFKPPKKGCVLGTHTWNKAGDLYVIDALIYRNRIRRKSISNCLTSLDSQ